MSREAADTFHSPLLDVPAQAEIEVRDRLVGAGLFAAGHVALVFGLAVVLTMCHVFLSAEFSVPIIFMLCALGGAVFSITLLESSSNERGYLIRVFVWTFSINVLLALASYYYYMSDHGTPFLATEQSPHDDAHFHRIGTNLAGDWIQNTTKGEHLLANYTYKGYPWLLAGVYYFSSLWGDMSPIAPRIVNAMCGGLLVVAIFAVATLAYGRAVAIRASVLGALFPTFWLYSGNTLRDIVIALLVTVSVVMVMRLERTTTALSRFLPMVGFVFSLSGVFFLRSLTFFALLSAFLLYFVMFARGVTLRIALGGAGIVLLTIGVFYGRDFGAPPAESLLGQADHYTEMIVTGASKESLAIQYIYSAPSYLFVPLNAIYTALAPIPPVKSVYLPHIIEGMGAVVWYFYLPFWVLGMYYGLKNRESLLPVIVTIVLFLGIATIIASARHKLQFQGLALVHVAEASMRLTGKIAPISAVVMLMLGGLAVTYIFLKMGG